VKLGDSDGTITIPTTSGPRHFRGNLSSNEVQIDLSKFVEMLENEKRLEERIRVLEEEQGRRTYKWIEVAKVVDAWRVIPRALMAVYIYVFLNSIEWFTSLGDPTTQQASLISVVVGAGSAWYAAYVATGGNKNNKG